MAVTEQDQWSGNSFSMDFMAMGTNCRILFSGPSNAAASCFKEQVAIWISGFEARYSRFRPDSLINRINRNAGKDWVAIDNELRSIFSICNWYHWTTKGIFDPTALPLIELWDYHSSNPVVPSDKKVKDALQLVGWNRIKQEDDRIFLPVKGMGIDIGGIGKEYSIDRVMEMANAAGIENILVDFGRDLRVHGVPPQKGPWRIGLENPLDPDECWTGIGIMDRAVATSGDYRRNFIAGDRLYGHIIDPRTGYPVANNCRSVSVIAPTCTEAGVIARTAFILGHEEGMDFIGRFAHASGAIVTDSMIIESQKFQQYVIEKNTQKTKQRERTA